MRNRFMGLLLAPLMLLLACNKDEKSCPYGPLNITAPQSEITALEAYLDQNSLIADPGPSGIYYTIQQQGTAPAPGLCDQIAVKYTGRFTNGTVFDNTPAGETAQFYLGTLIPGWQKGLPLIGKGGKMTLYVPPTLGYGAQGNAVIPPNSILIFDIELVDIIPY